MLGIYGKEWKRKEARNKKKKKKKKKKKNKKKKKKKKKKGFMFVDNNGKQLSKTKMTKLWNQATVQKLSGHSTRRSGAMEHVRQGLHIHELAFLGRWRSAVVLTYANDALQEVPANKIATFHGQGTDLDMVKAPWTPMPNPQTPMLRMPGTPTIQETTQMENWEKTPAEKLHRGEGPKLWVAVTDKRQGKKTWHRVTKAGWDMKMSEWGTACGWSFTKNPEKVSLSAHLQCNQVKCEECVEVMRARDKVKEGQNLADSMQEEAIEFFNLK